MRRRRRSLLALAGIALFAGIGANGSANAQTSTSASSDVASQFGGYALDGHAEGMSITYGSPGLIPGTPTPLVQASLPETATSMNKSPSGYALASLVYPGPVISDLGPVLALGGFDDQTKALGDNRPRTSDIPPYPVRSEAFYPSGPTSNSQDVGSGREIVTTTAQNAYGQALYGAATLPPVLQTGSITTTTESDIEQGLAVTRTRAELTDVTLLAGLVHMDSIVTDLVATSDAAQGAVGGTTTVNGLTFLGQPATIDGTGIHLAPQEADPSSKVSVPLGPLQGVDPALAPLNALLEQTLGTADADIGQLLEMGGVTMKLVQPSDVINGADASRQAGGVLVTIDYNGETEPVLSNILGLIDPTTLPSDYVDPCTTFHQPTPCPIPFTSPQTLFLALKAEHVETIGLASGFVHANASPPFSLPKLGTTGGLSVPGAPTSAFTSPTPAAGSGGGGGTSSGGGSSLGSASPIGFAATDPLSAAAAIALLALAGWAFWFGSGRLADNVLSVASSSCPEGLDHG